MTDPRVTPARGDIAAAHLRGEVQAARYVEGRPAAVVAGHAPLRSAPAPEAPLQTEALRGEAVTIYDAAAGWAWVQLAGDGYVGWMPATALGVPGAPSTHRVVVPLTLVFPRASIKAPPTAILPMGARVAVAAVEGRLARLDDGGYVPAEHLDPLANKAAAPGTHDPAATALRLVGAPYLWGGKTMTGIDCSGLVQVCLAMAGIAAPRDSDMQEAALGRPVASWTPTTLRRGDLIFWQGHVAIGLGRGRIVHANAHHMAVAVEDAAAAIARIEAAGQRVRTVRRLAPPRPSP